MKTVSAFLLLAVAVLAQDARVIQWETDFDAALARAKTENKPIMITFLMKGESANEDVARNHLHDASVVAESRKFVCIIGCIGLHGEAAADRCPTFDGLTCAQHEASEKRARTAYMDSPVVEAPQFLFLAPDGKKVLLRHVWLLAAQELRKKMQLAHAFHDPKNAPPELKEKRDRVLELLRQADGNNQDERRMALSALAAEDDPRVAEFLLKQTAPEVDSQRRLEAIDAMRGRGNAKMLPCLHALLKQKDTQIRIHVTATLEGIGMRESAKPLMDVLLKETQDRVRAHILRALSTCEKDPVVLRPQILKMLRSTAQADYVAACRVSEAQPRHDEIDKAITKLAASGNNAARMAAYHAIGVLKITEARGLLERQVPNDKEPTKSVGLWALAQLGGAPYTGETDVEAAVNDLQVDKDLYDGGGDDNGGGGRKGGGGGGGRGGGGRGR